MAVCYYGITQGNRDISCLPAGGGSDSPTFQHAKGWNGGDIRDIWARFDLLSGTPPSADATINYAKLWLASANTTENDLNLSIHWFLSNLPTGFTVAWSRSSTTVSAYFDVLNETDIPMDTRADVDVTDWFTDYHSAPAYVAGDPFGVALLGSPDRSAKINIRTYDYDPDLALMLEVDYTDAPPPPLPSLSVGVKIGSSIVWSTKRMKVGGVLV